MRGSGFFLKGDVAAARSLEKNFLLPRFLSLSNHFLNAWKHFAVDAAGVADEPDDMEFLPKTCAEKM